MLKVWTDSLPAATLSPVRIGSVFSYLPASVDARAASLTMPVTPASYNEAYGLAPVFDMNLPEGYLRELLRQRFSKATGEFRDSDLLAITGRSQIGRVRYTGLAEDLDAAVPFQSIDEILRERRGGKLYGHLMEEFATISGISGVQPKILIRDNEKISGVVQRVSFRSTTHIVKFAAPERYPHLPANEYICLSVAKRAGLPVPPHALSDNAGALVIERFDLSADGTYLGFEDFCVLNGFKSAQKYKGSYETAIAKRFWQFCGDDAKDDAANLFLLIALNCGLRNGDAHLKNFGALYESVEGVALLAPVYDIVTTRVYGDDQMALTLNGSPEWPSRGALQRYGEARLKLAPSAAALLLDRAAAAIAEALPSLEAFGRENPEFHDTGRSMAACWQDGLRGSLS